VESDSKITEDLMKPAMVLDIREVPPWTLLPFNLHVAIYLAWAEEYARGWYKTGSDLSIVAGETIVSDIQGVDTEGVLWKVEDGVEKHYRPSAVNGEIWDGLLREIDHDTFGQVGVRDWLRHSTGRTYLRGLR